MEMIDYSGMIVIHGELYRFDATRKYLISFDNAGNINALGNLQNRTHYITGYYNPYTKGLIKTIDPGIPVFQQEKLKRFTIPKQLINGTGIHGYDINNYNAISIANKQGFCYVDKELSERLNGKPATLPFDGILYKIDLKEREISQVAQPGNKFVLPPESWDSPTEAFYNVHTKQPVILSPDITEFPKDVVCVKFPRLNEMDVVGYTMLHGLAGYVLLSEYAWKMRPEKIRMVDVSQSEMAAVLRSNRLAREDKTEVEKKEKKDKRKGKWRKP